MIDMMVLGTASSYKTSITLRLERVGVKETPRLGPRKENSATPFSHPTRPYFIIHHSLQGDTLVKHMLKVANTPTIAIISVIYTER